MPPRGKPSSSHSSRPRPSSSHSSHSSHSSSSHSSFSHSAPSHSSPSSPSHGFSAPPPQQHHGYGGPPPQQHHGYGAPPPPPPHHNHAGPPPPPHHSGSGFLTGMAVGGAIERAREQERYRSASYAQQSTVQQPVVTQYDCPFCGGRVTAKISADGMNTMTCPYCGGALQSSNAVQQELRTTAQEPLYNSPNTPMRSYGTNSYAFGENSRSCLTIVVGLLVVGIIVAVGMFFLFRSHHSQENLPTGNQIGYNDGYDDVPEQHDAIYVSALGRDVPWNSEYESYYDKQTDCYFFLNTDVDPAIWQYWFEGISSDYGDYGWLEWDAKEARWYVQTGENSWELLPEEKGSDLWHFD